MTIIYLLRHGDAVPESVDPARPLSKLGDAEITDTILMQVADGPKIAEIWHSGKLRAKQSAEIAARMLGVKAVIEKPGLNPDDYVTPIAAQLKAANKNIMIVSHMPFLGKLYSLLKTGFEEKDKYDFGSGEVMVIRAISTN